MAEHSPPLWIKICGMTTEAAVAAALDSGVDAIGFVFAASPREVAPEAAASLAKPARGRALCVAVTRHPTQQAVDQILTQFAPDMLQTDAADLGMLRLPGLLGLLPVWRGSPSAAAPLPARVLFEGPASGTGSTCDWETARLVARRTELILAGGLNAANVGQAIAAVEPFGIDVSSGVEERRGIKSPALIADFVRAARDARRHA